MIPQIPNFAPVPSKKVKKQEYVPNTTDSEMSSGGNMLTIDTMGDIPPFVSQLLGPLGDNVVESPPTPAPVYSAGT